MTVAWFGAGWALALNAVSFAVSAVLTARLRVAARAARTSSGWADLREGWQEFAFRQWLWVVVAQYAIVVAALNANVGVLGPLAAEQHLGGARAWSVCRSTIVVTKAWCCHRDRRDDRLQGPP